MSMFIFPFGFYMVHFFYTYSVAIWGTNFSLHETEFVPFTNSLGTWAGAFQWKENWWYFTYCDDLCDANPSARGSSWAGWGGSFPWSSCQQASHWCFLHPDPLNTLHLHPPPKQLKSCSSLWLRLDFHITGYCISDFIYLINSLIK